MVAMDRCWILLHERAMRDAVRPIRDEIKGRVERLLADLGVLSASGDASVRG
jgi:hypothetical protein